MGDNIHSAFEETVFLSGTKACLRCDHIEDVESTAKFVGGELNIYALEKLARSDRRCAKCGNEAELGVTHAAFRMPDSGPWVVASSSDDRAFIAPERPHGGRAKIKAYMSGTEIDAASHLGQPVSMRSAWCEAIFYASLSGEPVTFPAGAGIRCHVTTDFRKNSLELFVSDDGCQEPASWLVDEAAALLASADLRCFIDADMEVVSERIAFQSMRRGLRVVSSDAEKVVVTSIGSIAEIEILVPRILNEAATNGYPVSGYAASQIEKTCNYAFLIKELEDKIVSTLSPKSVKAHGAETLSMKFDSGESLLADLSNLVNSDVAVVNKQISLWQKATS